MRGQHEDHGAAQGVRILHLGASGRLGRLLARAWAGPAGAGLDVRPVWRRAEGAPPGALLWSPLDEPMPEAEPVDVVIDTAGVTHGDAATLSLNAGLAEAALAAAERLGARWALLPSSAAVYGAGPCREDAEPEPASNYGRAKLAMEHAVAGRPATCLRIGNVVGADALVGRNEGSAVLDRLPDGRAPRRSFIGPEGLARVLAGLARLAARGQALPDVLNVATPEAVGMEALAEAAGFAWRHREAPPGVIPVVALDTARLEATLPGAAGPADPDAMVAEWRRLAPAAAEPTSVEGRP